ncbi:MAG: hypothetical protein JWP38_2279 [Herbaspirillum sp.]|nr:hypothetical protein [Herbaspirillum sp.]
MDVNYCMAYIQAEETAHAVLRKISAGIANPHDLWNVLCDLLTTIDPENKDASLATAIGYHRAIQKRLEAIACRSAL